MSNIYIHKKIFNIFFKEMQSKITVRYLCTPTRMAISKKADKTKCWQIVDKHH